MMSGRSSAWSAKATGLVAQDRQRPQEAFEQLAEALHFRLALAHPDQHLRFPALALTGLGKVLGGVENLLGLVEDCIGQVEEGAAAGGDHVQHA